MAEAMSCIEMMERHGLCVGDATGARFVQDHSRLVVPMIYGRCTEVAAKSFDLLPSPLKKPQLYKSSLVLSVIDRGAKY